LFSAGLGRKLALDRELGRSQNLHEPGISPEKKGTEVSAAPEGVKKRAKGQGLEKNKKRGERGKRVRGSDNDANVTRQKGKK